MVAIRDPGDRVAPNRVGGDRGVSARLRAIVAHRSVLKLLITRDLKVKYEKSVLGYVWSILEPLLLASVYYFVFGVIMGVGTEDYLVYLLAGLLPWLWASSTINASTGALTGQARLSSRILTALPFVMFVVLSLIEPQYMHPLLHTVGGIFVTLICVVMVLGGWMWMRRIVKVEA